MDEPKPAVKEEEEDVLVDGKHTRAQLEAMVKSCYPVLDQWSAVACVDEYLAKLVEKKEE
eukprot:6174063-Pleurochrysis_carterae.AAC.1